MVQVVAASAEKVDHRARQRHAEKFQLRMRRNDRVQTGEVLGKITRQRHGIGHRALFGQPVTGGDARDVVHHEKRRETVRRGVAPHGLRHPYAGAVCDAQQSEFFLARAAHRNTRGRIGTNDPAMTARPGSDLDLHIDGDILLNRPAGKLLPSEYSYCGAGVA